MNPTKQQTQTKYAMKIKYTQSGSWYLDAPFEDQPCKFVAGDIVEVKKIVKNGEYFNLHFADGTVASGCDKRWEVLDDETSETFWLRSTKDQEVTFDNGKRKFAKGELVKAKVWRDDGRYHDIVLADGTTGRVYSERFVRAYDAIVEPEPKSIHEMVDSPTSHPLVTFNPKNSNPMDTKTMQAAVDEINKQAAEQYASQAGRLANDIASTQVTKARYVEQYDQQIADLQAKARSLTLKVVTIADVFGAEAAK